MESHETFSSPSYVCPRTGALLLADGDRMADSEGAVAYPISDGIPVFLRYPPAETPEVNARLDRLNQLAASGWRDALQTVYAGDPGMLRYVTEVGRAKFVDLLPLRADSRVLEIGPGLGQITCQLAPRVESVCALEVVPGQAKFVQQRCRQEGFGNVHVAVGGDDCRLPYPDGHFDLVVLNLVLEWCASRCEAEDPQVVQLRLLCECARVLNATGTLYVATKNRFALRYVIGKPDEHVHGMRFGNALPRWLSRLALRLGGKARAPGLLHSHGGLERMLRLAGFHRLQSYWATPEVRYPAEYVSIDAAAIRDARRRKDFRQGEGRLVPALMARVPAPWVRYVTPGLAFLAGKGGSGESEENAAVHTRDRAPREPSQIA